MTEQENKFAQKRRDPLLKLGEYIEQEKYFSSDKSASYEKIKDTNNSQALRMRVSFGLVRHRFEHAFLSYSAGQSLGNVVELAEFALRELKRHKQDFPHDVYLLGEPDSFQFLIWCLCFSALSGKSEYLNATARMYGVDQGENRDSLITLISRSLGIYGTPDDINESLIFRKSYEYLLNAIKVGPSAPTKKERQASLKTYLRGWYKGMKECYWYGSHKTSVFVGYWSLEAALTTLLFDLDDSDYRHLAYYPKDWVDYARTQGFDRLLKSENLPNIQIAFPETACPVTAKWQDNLSADVISLTAGDTMPGSKVDENESARFWVCQIS